MTSANILNRIERACAQLRQDGQPVTLHRRRHRNRRRPHHPLPQPRPTRGRRPTPPPSRHQAATLTGLTDEIATLRIAVEAIADRVRKHEEQLRRLAAHND